MSEVYIKEPNTNGKAIFRTTHGDLEIELWATECPQACRNFCQLILEGYYNNTNFHRVIKDFIVQGGDGTNTGDGSESIYGKPYPDEIHPRLKFRYRGMMGVASAGKGTNTNGSQFFIVLNRAPSLDGKHTLFAKVVGQTVYNLVRLSEVEVNKKDVPLEPPRIIRAELVWDPFGDLEPRRLPEPPKSLTAAATEVHRRAPVKNKKVLSFGDEGSDDSDAEENAAPAAKGKSAHDLLNDPRLSKDAAYEVETQRSAKRPPPVTEKAAAQAGSVAKRAAVAAATVRAKASAEDAGSSSDEENSVDFGDGSDSDGRRPASAAELKSSRRQEAIMQLKREIAGVGAEPKQEARSRRTGSALEELRAGYQTRAPRQKATTKAGKQNEKEDIMSKLKAFRGRLGVLSSSHADDAARENERSPKNKEKDKKDKKDRAKDKGKDKKEPEPENGTFAAIWKEGDEEAEDDWLGGGGLKFHVTADKAFKLDRDRAQATLDIFDPLAKQGNAEVLAHARKKASEGMIPLRRKGPGKQKEDDRDRDRDKGKGRGK